MGSRARDDRDRRRSRWWLSPLTAALVGLLGLTVAASVAMAGGSTCQQYNPQTCNVVTPSTSSTAPAPGGATTPQTQTTGSTTQSAPPSNGGTPPPPPTSSSGLTPTPTLAAETTSGSASALPFTGLDLGLMGGVGAALLACGFAVRRMSRRPS